MKSHHLMCITEFERAFICLCCLPFINLNRSLKIVCSFECLILLKKSIKQIYIEHSFECVASVFLEITSVFSSPELKAQVSFSDHLSSVRPSVCLSVCLSVNFSHFHLLLQNHWANFNQTCHKASLGEGDSSLFKWRARPFPRGDNYEIVKIHWRF